MVIWLQSTKGHTLSLTRRVCGDNARRIGLLVSPHWAPGRRDVDRVCRNARTFLNIRARI